MGHNIPTLDFVSTGSTLLNLALSGSPWGGVAKGCMQWFVGDSGSGKTWLAHSLFAEASVNPQFKDYKLIYDNSENGALFDIEQYFGKALADRLEPPQGTRDEPVYSENVDDLYFNLYTHCVEGPAAEDGKPCIYVQDSMDGLGSKQQTEKFLEKRNVARKGLKKKVAGDFGMQKAKTNSEGLRLIVPKLIDSGSIFMAISQTRDNTDPHSMEKNTVAGGRALRFYAHTEIWTTQAGLLKRAVRDIDRVVGNNVKIQIKKNRYQGKRSTVEVPIYYSYGVDDITSCINYLVTEGHWSKNERGTKVNAPDFDHNGTLASLIKRIEEEGLEKDLRSLVGDVWDQVEKETALVRKPRY